MPFEKMNKKKAKKAKNQLFLLFFSCRYSPFFSMPGKLPHAKRMNYAISLQDKELRNTYHLMNAR